MAEVHISDQNLVVWFSHSSLEWSMWIGIGKLIQQRTREMHQNLSVEQQSASDCLKEKCVAVNMDNPGIVCLEVARP